MVGGCDNGSAGGFGKGCVREGKTKNRGLLVNKQGQRRDVRAQHRNVPRGGAANVAMLRSNVATFQRGYESNVTMLGSNVATFQGAINPTSRRCNLTS